MGKELIKKLLRENLLQKVIEANKKANEEKGKTIQFKPDREPEKKSIEEPFSDKSAAEKKKVKTLTLKIRNATQGPNKLLKLSQVGQAAGVIDADDAADRSELGKKVSGKPDADGKVRHLTPPEAAKLGKVVDNPTAYLSAAE